MTIVVITLTINGIIQVTNQRAGHECAGDRFDWCSLNGNQALDNKTTKQGECPS